MLCALHKFRKSIHARREERIHQSERFDSTTGRKGALKRKSARGIGGRRTVKNYE